MAVPEASFDALQQIIESFMGESERALRIKSAERKLYNKKKGKKGLFYQYSNYLLEDAYDQNLCDPLFHFFSLKPSLGDFLEVLKACRRNPAVRVPVPQLGPSTIEISIDASGMTACTCKVHIKR